MSLVRKLKPDRNITGAVVPLSMVPIFGIVTLIFDLRVGLIVTAIFMWAFALFYLYAYLRTWNFSQLFIFLYGAYAGYLILALTDYIGASRIEMVEFRLAYFTGFLFFGCLFIYLLLTRKMKWRGRELFELAGEHVEETGNGYTSRPRPVGKVEYSQAEVRAFARYAARHLIALSYATSKNITLVPVKMGEEYGRLLGLAGDYRDATWVNIDANGEVSVHISQKDYLDYREPLAFDQLCAALGNVFIGFLDLYTRGEGVRIVDRMDDLRIPVFS